MIIRFLTTEIQKEQKGRKQLLIGKIWNSQDAYNIMVGAIGTKKKGEDWNFAEVSLHPQDRIYIKENRWKKHRRDPDFLLYVENQPNGAQMVKEKRPTSA